MHGRLIGPRLAFQILGGHDIGVDLLCGHEVLQGQQLGLLRALPVRRRVRGDELDRVVGVIALGQQDEFLRVPEKLGLRFVAALLPDAIQHGKLELTVHLVKDRLWVGTLLLGSLVQLA